ncbi:unnamed protein product, partial [Brassica napus]
QCSDWASSEWVIELPSLKQRFFFRGAFDVTGQRSASIRQNHNAWRLKRWFLLEACGVDGFPMILASWMHMNFTKSEGDFELLNPHKRPIYAGIVEPRRSLTKKEPVPKIVPVAAL